MKYLICSVLGAILTSCTAGSVAVAEEIRIEAEDHGSLALAVAQEMLSKPKGLEYGAFLLCDKTCWSSDFAYGNENSISSSENLRIYPKEQTDQIVGYIHVHPKSNHSSYNREYLLNEANKTPSFQDYLAVQFFANDGKVYQPVSLWIVGPDDILRKFELPQP